MTAIKNLKSDLRKYSDPKKAIILKRFFKTGKGEYGEGDVFLGISVPDSRSIAKKYIKLSNSNIKILLKSKIHEERLVALVILVERFKKADDTEKKKIFNIYLENTKYINNWDLVDLSAPRIVGGYLLNKDKKILNKLAKSKLIWERRISIIATSYFIANGKFTKTVEISRLLISDDHDLIHKAVGWMLREVGKRNLEEEQLFLKKHYKKMPRTMLRYAIEKFPENLRKSYLSGTI